MRMARVFRGDEELRAHIMKVHHDPAALPTTWKAWPARDEYPVLVVRIQVAGFNDDRTSYIGVIAYISRTDWNRACKQAAESGFPLDHTQFVDTPDLSHLLEPT